MSRFSSIPTRFCATSTSRSSRTKPSSSSAKAAAARPSLLKLIIGLLRPTTGRVTFDGKVLADLPDRELTRQRLRFGFLFQGAALFDSLNVFDNVAFGLRHATPARSRRSARSCGNGCRKWACRPNVREKKPAELSGGMKKRVGLARALALDPEVMLYDEPTTGLDPIMTDVINELILQTSRQHPVTSIVVTHDMKTVLKVADRVVMFYPLSRLKPGEPQILFDGTVAELQLCSDERVRQFVEGEARERLRELAQTS